jgi:hypothetical protein
VAIECALQTGWLLERPTWTISPGSDFWHSGPQTAGPYRERPGAGVLGSEEKLPVDYRAKFQRDALIGAVVKFCASVVRIGRIDAETIDGERNRFSAAGRNGHDNHSGAH